MPELPVGTREQNSLFAGLLYPVSCFNYNLQVVLSVEWAMGSVVSCVAEMVFVDRILCMRVG